MPSPWWHLRVFRLLQLKQPNTESCRDDGTSQNPLNMLITKSMSGGGVLSQSSGHHGHSEKCNRDRDGAARDPRAGITVGPVAAIEAHAVVDAPDVQLVHLAAVGLCHAAPGRQGAVVPIASVSLEAQLVGGALGDNQLKRRLPLQDGAVVAPQVVTQRPGGEKVEAEHGNTQELQRVRPAG